jgi:hypothetical protein
MLGLGVLDFQPADLLERKGEVRIQLVFRLLGNGGRIKRGGAE